jgi:hypothetical protein
MEQLPWFSSLGAAQRADVGLVVQAGLAVFTAWLRDPSAGPPPGPEVFSVAPPELARHISLKQTVQLIRIMVEVVEEQVPQLAAPGDAPRLAEHVLRYSREMAFGAAEVYASAAEARGAWDARVEAGLVDALVRGGTGELTTSRAASLGWGRPDWVTALAAPPADEPAASAARLRAQARHDGLTLLVGEAGGGLVVVVGGTGDPAPALSRLAATLPDGPVVTAPVVDDLLAASAPVREALAGLAAVAAWPGAPRPVASSELLAERAVLGDPTARARLLAEVHAPLAAAGGDLLRTAATYLDCGTSVEATARTLFVHANTVRYRLRRVVDAVGRDVANPRDAQVVRVALVLGRGSPMPDLGPAELPPAHLPL